jgi:putative flippase GtrA
VRALVSRFYEEKSLPFQLARYLTIGGIVFCIDVGSFAGFLRLGIPLLVTTTIAYVLGITSHFTLNKYVNFRAHDRPVHSQAVTYAVVAFVCWLTTLGIVKGAVLLGVPPLGGKLLAIAFNLPLGFFGHRHLTFGRGILPVIRGSSERPPS